jgi:hypothetical protein
VKRLLWLRCLHPILHPHACIVGSKTGQILKTIMTNWLVFRGMCIFHYFCGRVVPCTLWGIEVPSNKNNITSKNWWSVRFWRCLSRLLWRCFSRRLWCTPPYPKTLNSLNHPKPLWNMPLFCGWFGVPPSCAQNFAIPIVPIHINDHTCKWHASTGAALGEISGRLHQRSSLK